MESFFNDPRLPKLKKRQQNHTTHNSTTNYIKIKEEQKKITAAKQQQSTSSAPPQTKRKLPPQHTHTPPTKKTRPTTTQHTPKPLQNKTKTTQLTHPPSDPKPDPDPNSTSPFSITHPLEPNLPKGKLTSSSKLVNLNRSSYKLWFDEDPNLPKKPPQDPFVRVLYPSGRHETFPLLIPKSDEDEYRPLDDLLNIITTTLSYYLTPHQSKQYFSEPHPILPFYNTQKSNSTDFRFLSEEQPSSADQPPTPPPDDQDQATTDTATLAPQIPVSHPSLDMSSKPLLKCLSRAIRKKNKTEFVQLIDWYNRVIKFLVQQDKIKKQVERGLPKGIWEIILRQSYDRQISTNLEVLQDYETWSSNVYGELRPSFVESILDELVDLKPDQVFVDLGSGIGNVVLQTALQIGCVSVGFEIMDGYSDLAGNQRDEVVARAHHLWNVKIGLPVLLHADFTKDPRVGKWLQQADVVLVNNQVFTPSLNESLTLLFLELKESAKIISLKPFIPSSFKLNQRNLDSPLAILTKPDPSLHLKNNNKKKNENAGNVVLSPLAPGTFGYPSNSVSWTCNPGKFFLAVVDRSRLINFSQDPL